MQDAAEVIEICQACGNEMDVSLVGPFSNVECPTCGEHNRVKRTFGPYQLERRHSLGGMSTVFVARDLTLNREVAVKILNEQWCEDEKRIAAFVEEARLTASFTHPNVVRVFRTGWAFGRFYIAMELVPGAHLEHWIRERGKIPEAEALTMAIQVVHGLKAAQAAGLIHRDMKPGNILLDEQGNAKIVDFGLALVMQAGSAQAQELWATPYYVPPEAVDGKPETFRSDMYAFGATLYHALAGVPPCSEESMSTDKLREAKKHIQLLQRVTDEVSVPTCRIVNRSMAYDPEDRYDSYDEMIALLEDARKQLLTGVATEPPKKSPFLLILAAVLTLGAAGGGVWWAMQPKPEVSGPESPKTPSISEHPESPSKAVDVLSLYQEAKSLLFSGKYEAASARLIAIREMPKVQEPTATWAGIEAVVVTALSGDLEKAQAEAATTRRHISDRAVVDAEVQQRMVPLLEEFGELPLISAKVLKKTGTRADVLAAMLGGLKNWEQGAIREALPFFENVAQSPNATQDSWLQFYQSVANHYLADSKLLLSDAMSETPKTASDSRATIAELESFLPQLKTQGRARFNIRAWQLDLAKLAKQQEIAEKTSASAAKISPKSPAVDTSEQIVEKITALGKTRDFKAARAYLKTQNGISLASAADHLIAGSEELLDKFTKDLKQAPVVIPLDTTSGKSLSKLAIGSSGELVGTTFSGKSEALKWADLSADSIIALHRHLGTRLTDKAELLRRHEMAIDFDWIAGNRTRALQAAERLGEAHPEFKSRWQAFLKLLP